MTNRNPDSIGFTSDERPSCWALSLLGQPSGTPVVKSLAVQTPQIIAHYAVPSLRWVRPAARSATELIAEKRELLNPVFSFRYKPRPNEEG